MDIEGASIAQKLKFLLAHAQGVTPLRLQAIARSAATHFGNATGRCAVRVIVARFSIKLFSFTGAQVAPLGVQAIAIHTATPSIAANGRCALNVVVAILVIIMVEPFAKMLRVCSD